MYIHVSRAVMIPLCADMTPKNKNKKKKKK